MIVEIATFRLASGTDEAWFIDLDGRLQAEFVYQQRGIVRRTTARGPDGEWVVVSFWQSGEDAEDAAAAFADHPATHDFRQAIDPASYTTRRYVTLD